MRDYEKIQISGHVIELSNFLKRNKTLLFPVKTLKPGFPIIRDSCSSVRTFSINCKRTASLLQ